MTEYAVSFVLKQVEVSATTADEAVVKAAKQVADDLPGNVSSVTLTKLDRITVTGLSGQP